MKQHILAVDDEPHILKLFERIITEKTGYRIVTSSNSLEIPEILKKNQFDLIITDLKMPGLDGMDILRMVKDNNRDEEVVIITAFGSFESALEALSKGVFDYITKPFKKEQIIFTIDRVMRWQKIKRETVKLSEIYNMEPYGDARGAFDREYVRRLRIRSDNNIKTMTERSGLSVELITSLSEEIKPE